MSLALALIALTQPVPPLASAEEARAGMYCRLYPVTEVRDGRVPAIDRTVLREFTINLSVPLNEVTSPSQISVEDATAILAGAPLTLFARSPDNGSYMALSDGSFFTFIPDEEKPYLFRTYVMKITKPLPKDAPPPYLFGVCAAFQNDGAAA